MEPFFFVAKKQMRELLEIRICSVSVRSHIERSVAVAIPLTLADELGLTDELFFHADEL
jgi:hypothetical protein